jgi:hypothetical protein
MYAAARQTAAAPAQHQLMRRRAVTLAGTKTAPASMRRRNLYRLISMTNASTAQTYPMPSSTGPLAGGRAWADTIQRVSHGPLTVMMPQPAIVPATTARVRMMLFWSLQVNFICIPPDCVPERFRIAARFSPMVRDACSIPRCISFCKYFLSFFDNFVKSDGNICTAPQNGVS